MMNKYKFNLPLHGYQDQPAVQYISEAIDEEIDYLSSLVEGFQEGVANGDQADYRAIYLGLVSLGFWDSSWDLAQKEAVLNVAPTLLDRYGTSEAVEIALTATVPGFRALGLGSSNLLADFFTVPAVIDAALPLHYFILMETGTAREGADWAQAQLIAEIFTPAIVKVLVVFEEFLADVGQAGDPLGS